MDSGPIRLFAVDPGSINSGFVLIDTEAKTILEKGNVPNEDILKRIYANEFDIFLYERFVSYMSGASVDGTLIWIGRFIEAASHKAEARYLTRAQVLAQLFKPFSKKKGSPDSQVRSRMIVLWQKETKGVTAHAWQALGLATAWLEKEKNDRDAGTT